MGRRFNTAGPCKPDIHYMLPTERRLQDVRALIDQQSCFVLHAPRQVGKTTALTTLAQTLTAEGRYAAVIVSVETGAPFKDDVNLAEGAILQGWRLAAEHWLPAELHPPPWSLADPGARIHAALSAWAEACPRPLVVFVDEIDALQEQTLVSALRQLRDGYSRRPKGFPWSLGLIGMRDVRDYRIVSGGADRARSASPFNVKSDSLTMRNFTADEVGELYAQHTADTGQRFDDDAVARAFELTHGQPWLVNALARQAVEKLITDPAQSITADGIDRAKEVLIQRQDTHLDSLAERLREPRVRRVIEPMLSGDVLGDVLDDDRRYVLDLGLLRRSEQGGLVVANRIYQEVIPRALASGVVDSLPQIAPTWLRADGTLDPDRLLTSFVAFWMQHGEALQRAAPYTEVAAQLVLMAFLQRVVNGGGRVEREYALGRGRIDLWVEHLGAKLAIELKAWRDRDKKAAVVEQGVTQIEAYMATVDAPLGWLVVFDQRKRRAKVTESSRTKRIKTKAGKVIVVVRL